VLTAAQMAERPSRAEVHLRMPAADDAAWIVTLDRSASTAFALPLGFEQETIAAALEAGEWASDERFGWAVLIDGEPAGFALVTSDGDDARVTLRIAPAARGRGAGREVLRQLADHHFAADPGLVRMTGRAHERNVPMQRVFHAAGFRMEARYRESFQSPSGVLASEWGYALTRRDWEAGRHRSSGEQLDLHGLTFTLEETVDGPDAPGLVVRFLQEGRRALARYDADELAEGELAGILNGGVLTYRFLHAVEHGPELTTTEGSGIARVQRRDDGRLEIVDRWTDEGGQHGRRVLVERRT
jgi:RimJ/RimL family protein N-acetyltransferase